MIGALVGGLKVGFPIVDVGAKEGWLFVGGYVGRVLSLNPCPLSTLLQVPQDALQFSFMKSGALEQ